MTITTNDFLYYIDVDSTLVFDCDSAHPDAMIVSYYDQIKYVRPHKKHIEYVKALKTRGYHVVVHTANGWRWGKEIVDKLGLVAYVDEVKTKGIKYLDDKPASDWSGIQVYIPED